MMEGPMKLDAIVGKTVLFSLANNEGLEHFGVSGRLFHGTVMGADVVGVWVENPEFKTIPTSDPYGKALPLEERAKRTFRASFLIRWDVIRSILIYTDREEFDRSEELGSGEHVGKIGFE